MTSENYERRCGKKWPQPIKSNILEPTSRNENIQESSKYNRNILSSEMILHYIRGNFHLTHTAFSEVGFPAVWLYPI